jgi:phage FluMu protein Com
MVLFHYDCRGMLKIEATKWFGRCTRHPMFDPEADGIGAIKGGCPRCQELQTIFESHQRTLQLMRTFAPIQTQHREPADPDPDSQQDLFASLV